MKYHVIVSGEGHDCQLFVGFEGKPEGDASAADIIAALKANPEACAEVLAGMGTTHFAARDAEWWHDRFLAEKARAEQAEHSLAASERALAALRYQVEAGGCELSTVGENCYHCRADAPCGLCRLRHRADAWRAKWEALETTRASCCDQMERERDEARAAHDELKGKIAEAVAEACGLAADDITHVASAAANTLRRLARERDEAMTLAEERRDYARAQNAKLSVENDALKAKLTAVERERDAARAERDSFIQDVRARLAKTEAVVEAARARLTDGLKSAAGLDHSGPGSASFSRIFPEDTYPTNEKEADAFVKARMRLWFTTWIVTPMQDALRALDSTDDSPVGAGTVSGGSGGIATREDAGTAPSGSERSTPPEPAGSIPCVIGPPLRFDSRGAFDDDDSPVGVAATACEHKRQRCENDHAVCRDCGAVNRAVTGVADWGPPETDRTDGSTGAVACKTCLRHPGPGNAEECAGTKGFPFQAGDDCGCRCHDDPPPDYLTRAELEALRRRVERLERGPRRVG